jgi:hypothetical protein
MLVRRSFSEGGLVMFNRRARAHRLHSSKKDELKRSLLALSLLLCPPNKAAKGNTVLLLAYSKYQAKSSEKHRLALCDSMRMVNWSAL